MGNKTEWIYGLCKNCGERLAPKRVRQSYKHHEPTSECNEPWPAPGPPCTCDFPHYNCTGHRFFSDGSCDCILHEGQLHWNL